MNKPANTSSAAAGAFDKNMNVDVKGFHKHQNEWGYARNAVNNTVVGDYGELSNEASNRLCAVAPYTIIGVIHVNGGEWAVFSTDDINSEVGLFIEDTCTYTTIVNDTCLAFQKDHLVIGVGRQTYDCGRQVYWDDGINPTRVLNLDDVPWEQDCIMDDGCQICFDSGRLDCEKIRLAPLVDNLSFRLERGAVSGELINGSYYVVGSYLIEGQRITDYSLPSNVVGLFQHDNLASSLEVHVENTDENFDEFELLLVQYANFNTVTRRIGVYSTRQKVIAIDQINESLPTVETGLLVIQNTVVDKTDAVYRNGEYLIRVGPTDKFDFNYQPLANQITSSWVSVEYDADYYRKGGSKTGSMRDETYPYFIRWVSNTGDKSRSYHIPGRVGTANELGPVGGDDVLPSDGTFPAYWEIYNTASVDPLFPLAGTTLPDGGVVLGGGPMAYMESSEIYDDDKPQIWNASSNPIWGSNAPKHDLCGKPIRHHRYPDNATDSGPDMITNHYDPTDGSKIRIMGVQFDNIKPPLDNDGNPIPYIVGYEILRGSREGNKTVLAKGMINNMREYVSTDQNLDKRHLYPNYPYNPTAPAPWENGNGNYVLDHFLSSLPTEYTPGGGIFTNAVNQNNAYLEDDVPLGQPIIAPQGGTYFQGGTNVLNDLLTFHSPETNFRNPFLSAKVLKVYGELHGTMLGSFQFPKDHPKHKFITNNAFLASAVVGIGYALVATEGKKTVTHYSPKTDYGGTYTQLGLSSGTTGVGGPSAIPAAAMIGANTAAQVAGQLTNNLLSNSMLSLLQSVVGVDPNIAADFSRSTSGLVAGFIGGAGGQDVYGREVSPWGAVPGLLRIIQGIPAFLTYYAEGVDKMLNIIYAFTPYRQYALQQISHCFYDQYAGPDIGDRRREITHQNYVDNQMQDFATDYRINNLFRSRTVALKLHQSLRLPHKRVDDTQALFSDVWPRSNSVPWRNEDYINAQFQRPASSHYAALKQKVSNQYGQINSIIQVPISQGTTPIAETTSGILFGGDTYIGRYTEKNTMFFFYEWLKNQPDGAVFNYKLRKMITHPRFWMDTDPFDVGEFVASLGTIFGGGSSVPPGFDPFMIDPAINTTDPSQTNFNPNAVCECGNLQDCFFTTSDLQEICDLEEERYQQQLYYDFVKDCACFVNDSHEPYCNDDNTVQNPATDPDYADCTSAYTQGCSQCPTWSGLFTSTSNEAGKYLDEGKGKWARRLNRVERKIERLNKRIERRKKRLYDDYLDGLDGNQQNFWQDLTAGLVTPSDKYAFDLRKPAGLFGFSVKQAWMYLFNSGVRDFYVESEINLDQRDWGEPPEQRHYDYLTYTNLRELFSTDHIRVGNYMKYDYSLSISKLFNNYVSWGSVQDRDYDPEVSETCYVYRPKRMLYSLPQSLENKDDNWRVFLPLNFKDFNSTPTSVKPVGKNGALILFENESPVQFMGVDQLQTDGGTKITIGDGGLFSQPLHNLVNADYPHEYGSCQNRLAVANTPAGIFYMSQNQGKIFQVMGEGLKEISAQGLKQWFVKYLPYKLVEDVPGFELTDNPVVGIGCQVIYDNENQVVFFCKKDYTVKDEFKSLLKYKGGRKFQYGSNEIELGNPIMFNSASWTISYDPKLGKWISYHDWHPDLTIPTKKTYMTTKHDGFWVHADRCDSYCNFYGTDFPFEVELSLHTQNKVNTLRNIAYFMESYVYSDNCNDRFHDLDFNFDEATIYNSEQCSGLLKLNLKPKSDPITMLSYPVTNFADIDILYSKEEQKFRFNQFWDITADRGEFNPSVQRTIFLTEPNGYVRNLNPVNLNYQKGAHQRKKFRHYKNSVILRRKVSGSRNMKISLGVQFNLSSPR